MFFSFSWWVSATCSKVSTTSSAHSKHFVTGDVNATGLCGLEIQETLEGALLVDAFQICTIVRLTKEDLKMSVTTGASCSAQCFSTTHTEAALTWTFPRVTALCWVVLAISRPFFNHEGPVNPFFTPIRDIYYSFNTPPCLWGITGYLSALYLLSVSVLIDLYLSFDLSLLAVSPVVSKRAFLLCFYFFVGRPEFVICMNFKPLVHTEIDLFRHICREMINLHIFKDILCKTVIPSLFQIFCRGFSRFSRLSQTGCW